MRRLLIVLFCAALWLANALPCRAQPALTTIQDTLYNVSAGAKIDQ
jgi:hypothetical protein